EPVPNPRLCNQVLRLRWIRLYLLPQSVDEDAQVFHFIAVIGTPHRLQQFPVRYRPVSVHHQVSEQIKLLRCEPYGLPGDARSACVEIDMQVFRPQPSRPFFRASWSPAHRGSYPSQQFLDAKWLGDVVVGAGVERLNFISLRISD